MMPDSKNLRVVAERLVAAAVKDGRIPRNKASAWVHYCSASNPVHRARSIEILADLQPGIPKPSSDWVV